MGEKVLEIVNTMSHVQPSINQNNDSLLRADGTVESLEKKTLVVSIDKESLHDDENGHLPRDSQTSTGTMDRLVIPHAKADYQ